MEGDVEKARRLTKEAEEDDLLSQELEHEVQVAYEAAREALARARKSSDKSQDALRRAMTVCNRVISEEAKKKKR